MNRNRDDIPRVSEDRILYSNCWEDADLLLEALNPGPEDIVLSVGSAGDNSFSLLSRAPKSVLVYDISKPQVFFIRLKKVAFATLSYDSLLGFLGYREEKDRVAILQQHLAPLLSSQENEFWNQRLPLISEGLIHSGKLEAYFRIFRKYVQGLLVSRDAVETFFSGPPTQEQLTKYKRKLRSPVLSTLLKIFLSKPVMSLAGRTRGFFNEVDVPVAEFLFQKFSDFVLHPESYKNLYVRYMASGEFDRGLPHYIREENFKAIRQNLDRMTVIQGDLLQGIKAQPGVTLVNASNIFEYLPIEGFETFGRDLHAHAPQLQRISYWNLMVDRVLSDVLPDYFESLDQQFPADRIYYYKRFVTEIPVK